MKIIVNMKEQSQSLTQKYEEVMGIMESQRVELEILKDSAKSYVATMHNTKDKIKFLEDQNEKVMTENSKMAIRSAFAFEELTPRHPALKIRVDLLGVKPPIKQKGIYTSSNEYINILFDHISRQQKRVYKQSVKISNLEEKMKKIKHRRIRNYRASTHSDRYPRFISKRNSSSTSLFNPIRKANSSGLLSVQLSLPVPVLESDKSI